MTQPTNLTLAFVRTELRKVDMTIRRTVDRELRVNRKGGVEATAYYTDDLRDALATGRIMSRGGDVTEAWRPF